jgi:hypothetical protein
VARGVLAARGMTSPVHHPSADKAIAQVSV